ncbi:MAG TPA: TorF family putative porin, partial [Herbaspirillum sp.]
MKKPILASAIAFTFTLAGNLACAQEAAPVPDNALSFNLGVVNDYRFRGISQTRFDPAVQGGVDYVYNPLGLYAGAWASNIKWIKDGVNASPAKT